MNVRKAIIGAAAAAMLIPGCLLVTAGGAAAATNGGGGGIGPDCSNLFYTLSTDQQELHFWQVERAQAVGQGASTSVEDAAIEFYLERIDEDIQALDDAGC
jgi:hypothetical protein